MAERVALEHELDAPPWRRVEATLMATSRAIRRAYDKRLAPLGLNLSEASLLAHVAEHGPVTQTWLAARLDMNRASAGSVVDMLVGRELIERLAHPSDRRVWLVTITDAGRHLVDEVRDVDASLRQELRAGLSRADRQQLATTLLRIHANLDALREREATD